MSATPSYSASSSSVQRPNGTPTSYLNKAELRRIGRASLRSRARLHAAELEEADAMDLDSDDEVDMVGGRPPRQHATLSPESSDAASERSDHEQPPRSNHTPFVPRPPQSHFSEAPMHVHPPPAAAAPLTASSATTSANTPTLSGAQPPRRPKSRFTFGLGAMFKFNPLNLVDEVKSAWVRQKEAHEARKREELIREARELERKEYERQYFALKAQGAFKPSFPKPEDFAEDAEPRLPQWKLDGMGSGGSRKRKHQELRRTSREQHIDHDQEPDEQLSDTEEDEPTAPTAPPPQKIPKRSTSANLLRRTKEVFTSSTSGSSSITAAKPPKPLTKREKAKQEKLAKKVSTLEEQLQKAKCELEAAAPPALPTPAVSADTSMLMPPPPVPNGKKRVEESEEEDEDTTMDEGFSMIPLSPVVQSANSSFVGDGKTSGRSRKPTAKTLEMEKVKKGRGKVKAEEVEV